jgi:hypothetical protein
MYAENYKCPLVSSRPTIGSTRHPDKDNKEQPQPLIPFTATVNAGAQYKKELG